GTETRRGLRSWSASRAAARTAARAQPPPIQPSEMVPSARITALAPALAAVAATVRTTVASANGSPFCLRVAARSMTSLRSITLDLSVVPAQGRPHDHRARKICIRPLSMGPRLRGDDIVCANCNRISDPREVRLERRQAVEIVGRREQVDVGQRRLHAARHRRIVAPADQRVEPYDAAAAPAPAPHLGGATLRLAEVV